MEFNKLSFHIFYYDHNYMEHVIEQCPQVAYILLLAVNTAWFIMHSRYYHKKKREVTTHANAHLLNLDSKTVIRSAWNHFCLLHSIPVSTCSIVCLHNS